MTKAVLQSASSSVEVDAVFVEWFARFSSALESSDVSTLSSLIAPDGWWRDLLALTWNLTTRRGTDAIEPMLKEALGTVVVTNVLIDGDRARRSATRTRRRRVAGLDGTNSSRGPQGLRACARRSSSRAPQSWG